ncbi:MAG TPA: hypothetical protein VF580_00530, partial [Thermoanaerobaculia bacterium]
PRRRRAEMIVALSSGLVVLAAAAYLMAFPNDPLFGGRQAPLSSGAVLASIAATAMGSVFLLSRRAGSRLSGRLALGMLSALLVAAGVESAGFIRRDLLTHRVGIREIADQVAPLVARRAPGDLSFVAPDPDALAFRLFRRGRTWAGIENPVQATEGSPEFWVTRGTGPIGSAMPPRRLCDWLESATDEVSAQVEARARRRLGLRVFVSRRTSLPPS